MTRRQLFFTAASAALLPCTGMAECEERRRPRRWIVFDPNNSLARESARGFQAALERNGRRFELSDSMPACRAEFIVLPFAAAFSRQQALGLHRQLASGCSVVLESGASFASPGEIVRQRMIWERVFGVCTDFSSTRPAGDPTGYVHYRWPADARIRHFGEFMSLSAGDAEGIATYGGETVAIRRRIGRGSLLFLGSPLGPMLAAEDHQAAELAAGIFQHSTFN